MISKDCPTAQPPVDTSPQTSEQYDYDAYGQTFAWNLDDPSTLARPSTDLLYAGEQWDADLGMQYLRARYYLPEQGIFNRLDPFFGNLEDPQSLNKYAYVHGDPVNMVDPEGLWCAPWTVGRMVERPIRVWHTRSHPGNRNLYDKGIPGTGVLLRPDIRNDTLKEVGEIKPVSPYGFATGPLQLGTYLQVLNGLPGVSRGGIPISVPAYLGGGWKPMKWSPGVKNIPLPTCPGVTAWTIGTFQGVLYYVHFQNRNGLGLATAMAAAALRSMIESLTYSFEAIVDNVLGPFRGGAVPAWALAMVASQMLGVYMMSNVLPRMIFAGAALSGVYLVSNLAMSLNLSIVSRGLI